LAISEPDELLTVAQIADEMKVTPETVRRWINGGQLRGNAVTRRSGYRVRRSDLDELIDLRGGVAPTVSAPEAQPAIGVAERVTLRR
jgi:excisionase family DNA binding protein